MSVVVSRTVAPQSAASFGPPIGKNSFLPPTANSFAPSAAGNGLLPPSGTNSFKPLTLGQSTMVRPNVSTSSFAVPGGSTTVLPTPATTTTAVASTPSVPVTPTKSFNITKSASHAKLPSGGSFTLQPEDGPHLVPATSSFSALPLTGGYGACSPMPTPTTTSYGIAPSTSPFPRMTCSPAVPPTSPFQHGFLIGEKVFWTKADYEIPRGTIGHVIGFTDDRVRVQFRHDWWDIAPEELGKATTYLGNPMNGPFAFKAHPTSDDEASEDDHHGKGKATGHKADGHKSDGHGHKSESHGHKADGHKSDGHGHKSESHKGDGSQKKSSEKEKTRSKSKSSSGNKEKSGSKKQSSSKSRDEPRSGDREVREVRPKSKKKKDGCCQQ